jgi:ParB family chromosome partitioning protein
MRNMENTEERIFIKLDKLQPNPYQPPTRVAVPEETARQFGQSILEQSLLQLPVVRMVDGRYEVGDGWLRLSGFKWLAVNGHPEYSEMPVILRGFTDQQMADLVIETNDTRKQLNPIERAWYYRKYLADFRNVTQAEFAQRRGISQGELANTMRLLDLPEKVRGMIISHEISESHGRALLALKEPLAMIDFAANITTYGWSVANLDSNIKTYLEAQKPKLMETPPPPEPIKGKVKLSKRVYGDFPFQATYAEPGIYDAYVNPHGAVSVKATNGKLLGVKPGEYEWLGNISTAAEATTTDLKRMEEPGAKVRLELNIDAAKKELCSDCRYTTNCEKTQIKIDDAGAGSCENRELETGAGEETKEEEAEKLTANERAGLPKVDGNTKAVKLGPAKEPPKKTPPAPAKTPAAVKPKWKRKAVIEEKGETVMVSIGKVGEMPVFKSFPGTIETTITMIEVFIQETTAGWLKEDK